jgi:5-methylcytosine-specific restriction endonuclease McrA
MERLKINFDAGGDVLVLNTDGSPVNVLPISTMSWRDAITSMWSETVEPIEYYDDWFVRSPSVEMQVPAVVMTKSYVKPGRNMKFSRANVFLRDNHLCQYCSHRFTYDELTMDHVVPRKDGGTTSWENIVASCGPCNAQKGHNRHIKPKNMPYRPSYFEMAAKAKSRPIVIKHPSWNNYLMWPEDKVKLIGQK